jgi:hypothetical protein
LTIPTAILIVIRKLSPRCETKVRRGMLYIEYVSRRPGVPLATFHEGALAGQEGWAGDFAEDRLVLNAARTWRLGPEPEYFSVWACSGFERLNAWERTFKGGNADRFQDPFQAVARIDVAGWYDELVPAQHHRGGLYYVEFFDPARIGTTGTSGRAQLVSWFHERFDPQSGVEPILLAIRQGLLAPPPGGLAAWRLPGYESLALTHGEVEALVDRVAAGLYVDVGEEVL